MTFPVRCVRTAPRVGYAIGSDTDAMARTMEKSGEKLKTEIIDAVVAQAGVSIGVQIALMFIPVIGWALSGCIAAIQQLTGMIYGKRTQEIISGTMESIKARAEANKKLVEEAGRAVYAEELPAARELAMSNESLAGISDFFSRLEDSAKKIVKRIGDSTVKTVKDSNRQLEILSRINPLGVARLTIREGILDPIKHAAEGLENVGLVKEGSASGAIEKASNQIDRPMETASVMVVSPGEAIRVTSKAYSRAGAAAFRMAGDERTAHKIRNTGRQAENVGTSLKTAFVPTGFYNLMTGRESYLAAKNACEEMRVKAFAELDRMKREAMERFRSPEGRAEMRISIARALRNDPAFQEYMQEVAAIDAEAAQERARQEAIQRAAMQQLANGETPGIDEGGSGGTVLGVAAAAAAAFAVTF